MRLYRSVYRFGLDFSDLSSRITTEGQRNYTVQGTGFKAIPGYLSKQANSKKAVIMIHEWWGLNKSICQTADIFNAGKYSVFVPDLYRAHPAKDAENAGHKMSGLDWKGALQDIKNVKQHFEKQGKGVYVMGFCMGGALTIASICSMAGWKAASPYYGIPDLKSFNLANIKCPTLAHFGQDDEAQGFSCAKSAKNLEAECKKAKAPVEVKIWPKANHAFCNQDSRYFSSATRDQAFKLTQQLFDKN